MVRSVRDIRKDEITDAVLEMLVEKGPAALNTRAVAEHISMSKASLYQHFDSLEEILMASVDKLHGRIDALIRRAEQVCQSPLDTLYLLSKEVPTVTTLIAAFLNLRSHSGPQSGTWTTDLEERKRRFGAYLHSIMQRLVADGQTRDDLTADDLSVLFKRLHRGVAMERAEREIDQDFDTEAKIAQAWDLFCRAALKRDVYRPDKAGTHLE